MTKTQTKLRESPPQRGKRRVQLHLVREGEPIPEMIPPRMGKSRRRKHAAPQPISVQSEVHCPLCETAITRFDADIFLATGHCGPCRDGLQEP